MSHDVSPFDGEYAHSQPAGMTHVAIDGKHLAPGCDVFRVRGVTCAGFAARESGAHFPHPVVEVASLRRRVGRATSRTEHANRL
jgi:hypothetical protein